MGLDVKDCMEASGSGAHEMLSHFLNTMEHHPSLGALALMDVVSRQRTWCSDEACAQNLVPGQLHMLYKCFLMSVSSGLAACLLCTECFQVLLSKVNPRAFSRPLLMRQRHIKDGPLAMLRTYSPDVIASLQMSVLKIRSAEYGSRSVPTNFLQQRLGFVPVHVEVVPPFTSCSPGSIQDSSQCGHTLVDDMSVDARDTLSIRGILHRARHIDAASFRPGQPSTPLWSTTLCLHRLLSIIQ